MTTPFPSTILQMNPQTARKPDSTRPKAAPSSWWGPLFGFSSDPDYVTKPGSVCSDPEPGRSSRFAPGCFTEDKAKELRKKMRETTTFHDIMYHSAIASRLATDVSDS